MLTLGSATSGYAATGSARIEAMPARITAIVITHANTGRLAKNRASTSALLGLRVGPGRRRLGPGRRTLDGLARRGSGLGRRDLDRVHRHPGADLVEPLDDQPVAGGQAAGHQPAIGDRAVGDQRP